MMRILIAVLFATFTGQVVCGQPKDTDFYYEIPEYPNSFHAGAVAARMIDGLGFRYYWATEGLTELDLAFKPSEEARSVEETVDHIVNLTQILFNAVSKEPFKGSDFGDLTFSQKRDFTLSNIQKSREILLEASEEDLADFKMVFASGGEFPFWNLLNGPIADAVNHVGQIITLRRTNGNPINQNISVLRGVVKK